MDHYMTETTVPILTPPFADSKSFTLTTLSYAGGFSIALNDDFAPFISVSGTHTLKDREIVPLASNPFVQEFNIINLRIGFDYRLSKAMYIEPSVIFGLSEDASDVSFNLSIPYQF